MSRDVRVYQTKEDMYVSIDGKVYSNNKLTDFRVSGSVDGDYDLDIDKKFVDAVLVGNHLVMYDDNDRAIITDEIERIRALIFNIEFYGFDDKELVKLVTEETLSGKLNYTQ